MSVEVAAAGQMHLVEAYVDQRNEIHDYEGEVSVSVLLGSIQNSGYNWDAVGTVRLEVGRLACCCTVIRVRHSARGLGKIYLRGDDYMQAEALGHRVGRAGDRALGFDSTDNQLACSPLALEAGWGAVVDPDVEEHEGTA